MIGELVLARILARPVMTILSLLSNSTFDKPRTSTNGAALVLSLYLRPKKRAPSTTSRNDLVRTLKVRATSSLSPASSTKDPMTSSCVKEPLTVTENGSKIKGPPGAIRFTSGTPPKSNRLRSIFRLESTIEPYSLMGGNSGSSTPAFLRRTAEATWVAFSAACAAVCDIPCDIDFTDLLMAFSGPSPFAFSASKLSSSSSPSSGFNPAMSSTISWYSSRSTAPSPLKSYRPTSFDARSPTESLSVSTSDIILKASASSS
mmetsp:Transcript_36156/g.87446  ORF Transcript_36156/g.87446 Transcript_36156/m.87446 type:complete len:260 (+) Transcript_36156:927-1706(+)